jgi:hypothetical protein
MLSKTRRRWRQRSYSESERDEPVDITFLVETEDESSRRPLQSYAVLIAEALEASELKQLPLGDIYEHICANHSFFRHNPDVGWRNNVRHNLSLNEAFVKASTPTKGHRHHTHGSRRGSLWAFNPSVNVHIHNGRLLVTAKDRGRPGRSQSLPFYIQPTQEHPLLLPKPQRAPGAYMQILNELSALHQQRQQQRLFDNDSDEEWLASVNFHGELGTPPWLHLDALAASQLPTDEGSSDLLRPFDKMNDLSVLSSPRSIEMLANEIMRRQPMLLPKPASLQNPKPSETIVRRDPLMGYHQFHFMPGERRRSLPI